MKVELIVNGTVKVVLLPENDLEKLALENIGKTDIQPTVINSQIQILNKVVHEGLILEAKKNSNE